jgi:hypothetical protein
MDIKVGGVTKKEFDENALWVVKFTDRPRMVDTYPNIVKALGEHFFSSDNVRDLDLLCYEGQPECLKGFFNKLREIDREHGWMTIPDIFEKFGVAS